MSGFVHLHLHTEYSLLDGATRISEIADKALADGQDAVAITDHGVMYGAVAFYDAMKAKGIRPIIGCECYVAARSRFDREGRQDASGHHLILLCKNAVGYRNLCYMVSESFIHGFYMKPRIDMELLREHHEGLIALSGCVAGQIPQLILAGSMPEAEKAALQMRDIFGEDFFLEVQDHGMDEERRVAFGLRLLHERTGIPLVATNDVHYLEREDADTQAILLCIQTNRVITDGRPFGFQSDEYYFKTKAEMEARFAAYEDAIANTQRIADRCSFDFDFSRLHLPTFTPEYGMTHAEKLRRDAYEGLRRREAAGRLALDRHSHEEYRDRLEYELSVIDSMGFDAYFLIVADFVGYAKGQGIPVGPGRGSGAGSLVAFCIGITDVDPLAFDLLFERFLNPERVSMPDFDIDFCYVRREEVIQYVKDRYGEDRVAQIVTFGTLAARAVVRDVGRALGMPYARVDTVAKLIPREMNITIDAALKRRELLTLYETDREVHRLLDISRRLEGMPRHASTHAAGVVMTELPTYEYVPLSYSGTGIVTQFDMNTDARLGLVKFDFLGLRYITVIRDAEREIRRQVPDFDITAIPQQDERTLRLLREARTDGVFQLESAGMKQVLMRLVPTCLEDVIAVIALYRPGPMDSIDTFIARKHGREPIQYRVPALGEILDVTYGCIVYQEQVMQICRKLAGYSYARADLVRRAMAKKKTEAMQAERESFLAGCRENGVDAAAAEEIFDDMASFAKYAFNKSHATAYGIISYQTAYLKANYPAAYFAALLTSERDVSQTTGKLARYMADAKKCGVRVLAPDINESGVHFTVVDGSVRFGLLAIRNVGRSFAEAVVQERERGRFTSFDSFLSRMSGSVELNRRTLESLIKCGVFDSLGVTRAALLSCYESILDAEHDRARNNISGQMDLFSMGTGGEQPDAGYPFPDVPEFSQKELLLLEKESSGMYFSGHMIDSYSRCISELHVDAIGDILEEMADGEVTEGARYRDGATVTVAAILSGKKLKTLKNGETMAFLTVEDRYGEIGVIVFAKLYARYASDLVLENAVKITGRISAEEGETPELILSTLTPLVSDAEYAATHAAPPTAARATAPAQAPRLYLRVTDVTEQTLRPLYRIAGLHPGDCPVVLYDMSTGRYLARRDLSLSATPELLHRLTERYGEGNVILR